MTLDEFSSYCWTVLPLSKKTISNYRGAYSRNIAHALGNKELDKISKSEFLDILAPWRRLIIIKH